jgi:hypothetical protein
MDVTDAQRKVCARFGVAPDPPAPGSRLGLAGVGGTRPWPLNGLRHPPERGTNGWYLWAGAAEPAQDPGFFDALHVEHLAEHWPEAGPYLALPPGWRFLVAPGHEDVWYDEAPLRPE